MKQTGIVRKIDDLGRIVIPKEIRKTFRIREGDSFEILIDDNGVITLSKYQQMESMKENARKYLDIIGSLITLPICITDTENIIATTIEIRKEYIDKNMSDEVRIIIGERTSWNTKTNLPVKLISKDDEKQYTSQIIIPIISNTDLIGSIMIFSRQTGKIIGELEKNVAVMLSKLLAEKFED